MKTTYRPRQKKIAWSETNRESYKKLKCGNAVDVQHPNRPTASNAPVPDLGKASASGVLRQMLKWTNYNTEFLTHSSPLTLHAIQKNKTNRSTKVALTQSLLFPPIEGSRMTSSEVICANISASTVLPVESDKLKAIYNQLSSSNFNKENALIRLFVNRQRDADNFSKTRVKYASGAAKKILNAGPHVTGLTRSESANKKCSQQTNAKSNSTALNSKRKKPNETSRYASDGRATPNEINPAGSQTENNLLCSEAAVGAESECASDKDTQDVQHSQEEYYTNQKIAEWVSKVNATLFSPSSDATSIINIGEEQDTAIKVIYDED